MPIIRRLSGMVSSNPPGVPLAGRTPVGSSISSVRRGRDVVGPKGKVVF